MTGGRRRRLLAALAAAVVALAPAPPARAASPGQFAADRGAVLYRAGDLPGARAAFREAVRLDPRSSNAWHSLGWVEYRLGNEEEALRIWADLLRIEPERADTRAAVAALRSARERRADGEAEREGADRGESGPEAPAEPPWIVMPAPLGPAPSPPLPPSPAKPAPGPGGLLERARRALAKGDVEETALSVDALLGAPEFDERWASRVAELFQRAGAVDRGIALLDRQGLPAAAARARGLSQLFTARGAAESRSGELDGAARSFARAIAFEPHNRVALRGLGWAHRSAGRLDEAQAAWERYARAYPALAEPRDLLVGLLLDRRAYAAALVEARASLAIDPGPKGAQLRLIRALFGLVQLREAREVSAALAARLPDDVQAQRVYADALTKSRAFGQAARQWRRVLDLDPGSEIAKQNWVRSLYEDGRADEAVGAATSMASAPDAPSSALELLAEDAKVRHDLAESARWYQELTRRFPARVTYWRSLMQMLDLQGRFREQLAVAREAAARLPDRAELELDLATAFGNVGALEEAVARTRRYLAIFPDSRAAYQGLIDLLRRSGDNSGALALLDRSGPAVYQDHDRALLGASLRARRRDLQAAERILQGVVNARGEARYVPIILYHGIVAHSRSVQTPAAVFDAQLAALASAGYTSITLTELARMARGEQPFPSRPILISFDDARSDSFALGDAILARYGFKATMFVPTARIGAEDAFHAGWATIARYASTGRWDMQAHGHAAHTPVRIDAAGNAGEFLAYRAYRPEDERSETPAEYLARVDEDHRECKGELERHLRDHPVLGYAFPLNQVAFAQPGFKGELSGANERLARRHFRFGLVQDDSGYNAIRPGAPPPFWLRRFEVPGDWDGEQLLAHLARKEPIRAARLQLARLATDDGRPRAARRMVEEIVREEPLVAPEGEAVLAHVAWEEERPREAAAHFAASPRPEPGAKPASALGTRLSWRNRPSGGAESSVFSDSDGRAVLDLGARFSRPLAGQLDLDVRAGMLQLEDRFAPSLAGPQVMAEISGTLGNSLGVEGWGQFRQLSGAPSSANGGAAIRLRREQHAFSLRWGYEDIETVPAALLGIQRHDLTAGYSFVSPSQRIRTSGSVFAFDDGNRRADLHALAFRMFGSTAEWGVGASLDFEDSTRGSREYYAPQGLVVGMGRATFRRAWSDSSSVLIGAGFGIARDDPNGFRWSGRADLRLSRLWGARRAFETSAGLEWREVPGYRSVMATVRLGMRF